MEIEELGKYVKKGLIASMLSVAGYTFGNLMVYGNSFGHISGALPADFRLYTAFASFVIGLLLE